MGFDLELISVDYATIESTVYGDAPPEERPHFIGGWGWWPDYNDPWNQLWPNFTEANIGGGGSNGGAWVNPRFEEIMAEAEHFESEEQLDELMKEAQNILTEQDPPAIYYGQVVLTRFSAPTSRGSSRTRSTSTASTSTACRGRRPEGSSEHRRTSRSAVRNETSTRGQIGPWVSTMPNGRIRTGHAHCRYRHTSQSNPAR